MTTTSTSPRICCYHLHPMMPLQTTTVKEVERSRSIVRPSPIASPTRSSPMEVQTSTDNSCFDPRIRYRCPAMPPQDHLPQVPRKHELLQTDILTVRASDIDQEHWHLLNLHLGSKRECACCKKTGIIVYKGELFTRTGAVEINSCMRCGRTFGQLPDIAKPVLNAIPVPSSTTMKSTASKGNKGNAKGIKKFWLQHSY